MTDREKDERYAVIMELIRLDLEELILKSNIEELQVEITKLRQRLAER